MKKLLSELKLTLKSHETLNNKLWDDKTLKKEVRVALWKIAREWAKFSNIPQSAIKDVIVTGGNANYNYTDQSDIDLHLVVDKEQIDCNDVLDDYLQAKKQLWTLTHDVTIKGHPVELYAQDFRDPFRKGQGIYSIESNKWLQEPTKYKIDRSHPEVTRKVKEITHQIDSLINSKSDDIDAFKKMKEKLKKMRTTAIQTGGESAPENLVFKELRNRGIIERLNRFMRTLEDKSLSI